ncbi:MAG TPA: hypothetical protein VIL20_10425 [Sandaracinaceae bacterium]
MRRRCTTGARPSAFAHLALAACFALSGCTAAGSPPARTGPEREPSAVHDTSAGSNEEGSSGAARTGASADRGDGAGEDPRGARCPARYAEARALDVDCERESAPHCSYPEGRCACEPRRRCSGVPPRPEEEEAARRRVWTCRDAPPALRPDGCPGVPPSEGEPCRVSAPFCDYGDCYFVRYRCVGGRWQRGIVAGPPRAAPRR